VLVCVWSRGRVSLIPVRGEPKEPRYKGRKVEVLVHVVPYR